MGRLVRHSFSDGGSLLFAAMPFSTKRFSLFTNHLVWLLSPSSLCAFATLANVVRRLPEGKWGDLSSIVPGPRATEEVRFSWLFRFPPITDHFPTRLRGVLFAQRIRQLLQILIWRHSVRLCQLFCRI
jgi:hypothetical protein